MQHNLEEFTGPSLWTLFLALLVWSLLAAVVLTWPVCGLVLAMYRRSVRAGMRGRLRRHFVRDAADLARRLDELDLRPDLDGRYRVNEMRCHDDTWRPTLQALVPAVDAVLIDLRGLTPRRTGVVHEIERLVALLPLDRVVALTDTTADAGVLRWALERAAGLAPAGAPVRDDPAPALRTLALSGRRAVDLARVLDAVGRAAEPNRAGVAA